MKQVVTVIENRRRENRKPILLPFLLGLLFAQGACAQKSPDLDLQKSESDKVSKGAELNASANNKNQPMDRKKQILFAQSELSNKLGITINELGLPSVRSVTWRSGAIGCPEKGAAYTQALVPGTLMIFERDGVVYRYHAKRNGTPFHCPNSRAESPSANASDI